MKVYLSPDYLLLTPCLPSYTSHTHGRMKSCGNCHGILKAAG